MSPTFLGRVFDERFLMHRLRATSLGGVAGGVLAAVLFAYHYYAEHTVRWELLAIAVTMAVVKWIVMAWYLATD